MPVITPDPDDDDERDLTPEERERMRKAFENLRGAMLPKFDFDLASLTGLSKIQESIAKSVTIPESTLKNLTANLEPFTGMSDAVREILKPITDAQSAWSKQLSVINSDALKSLRVMPEMDSVFAQITKNADFGESLTRIGEQFARQHEGIFKSLAESAKKLSTAFFPSNLRDIEDLKLSEVEEVVMVDGIALYGLPRTEIAEAIIRADGTEARLDVIDHEWKSIADDCRALIGNCDHADVADWVTAAVSALDALGDGHDAPAQALVASLIDSIVTDFMGDRDTKRKFTPDRRGKRTTEEYDNLGVREFHALAPIWKTFQQFHVEDGDEIPTEFSRHATAHTVSAHQYTRRNAVQGLMLACSLIHFINEWAVWQEDAA